MALANLAYKHVLTLDNAKQLALTCLCIDRVELLKKVDDVALGLVEVETLLLCWSSDGPPFWNQLPKGDIVSFKIDQRLQTQDEFLELLVDGCIFVHEYFSTTFDWIP